MFFSFAYYMQALLSDITYPSLLCMILFCMYRPFFFEVGLGTSAQAKWRAGSQEVSARGDVGG